MPLAMLHSCQTLNTDFNSERVKDVGIIGFDFYFPLTFVEQSDLEKYYGVSEGKYTIGLAQERMAFTGDREDVNSMALTAVKRLMDSSKISYLDIGRIEVGTESIVDKSKSVKTVLMQLFEEHGNTDIEGVMSINACYGGTAALFNSVAWVESSAWDGRFALVVTSDIAVYDHGNARPTGGAGAVALLIGPNAPLVLNTVRASHMKNTYDFYKPVFSSEYPQVNGAQSISCYYDALDKCYSRFIDKAGSSTGKKYNVDSFDYFVFHSPFSKLVQKSFGRLVYNDMIRSEQFANDELEKLSDKELEKKMIHISKQKFSEKVLPSTFASKNLGNSYTSSIFFGLISLLAMEDPVDKDIVLFSYGSGLTSSMYWLTCKKSMKRWVDSSAFFKRFSNRLRQTPEEFEYALSLREKLIKTPHSYHPISSIDLLDFQTFYLDHIDSEYKRVYTLKSSQI
ncbi:Hydroxymethylglutaryl-coenzyme A synthase domain-containing protein [Rozella allomycis CSF55]|uniref:Hydroxymethylglutaryl-CoA synthase n=1 Tax=Rozella allomycis (strain CSF55) TaxID=988480 RepID=A0A075AW58_ROZAC|nr:Hydroxymethylglutaryl-coenzyme A synthase domain-containing protein [Rozella allomycis CSF55]|eukprot:EPZ34392.1 Hydroxymethylglutaryl-coenzyme A synthase domain-containing protein [Rozella allomycis CSF55]